MSYKRLSSSSDTAISKIGGSFDLGGSLDNVEMVLAEWAQGFTRETTNNLKRTRSVASGSLLESIRYELGQSNGGYTLTIYVADYYDFVNKGVKGVRDQSKALNSPYSFRTLTVGYKMADSLTKWAKSHTLKSRVQNKKFSHNKMKTFTELGEGFRLGMAIKKRGLNATHFWDSAFDKLYPGLAPKLAEALQKDVTAVLKELVVKRGMVR